MTSIRTEPTYTLYATFDNIGGLKARLRSALVALLWAGWRILRWTKTYLPRVTLEIEQRYNHIPDTSSLSIRTSGLLGNNIWH